MQIFRSLLAIIFLSGSVRAADEENLARIRSGIARLNELYWSPTLNIWLDRPGDDLRAFYDGRRNPPWWPSANAVEMLLDFMATTGTSEYEASIEALYDLRKDHRALTERVVAELKKRGQWSEADEREFQLREQKSAGRKASPTDYYSDFQNEYLDDSGWWALTWLKMYDRTRAAKYLATAWTIHAHMAKNWQSDKGGGIMWCEDEDKQRPNAITNNLFIILSARLYERTKEPEFLSWAEKTLAWFRETALYDGVAVVDAPGHSGDYWSYNQGTFIGGLTALYLATGRQEFLDEAANVTGTVLRQSGLMQPDGVLIEKMGTDGDASLFKGVFARYLAQLRDVLTARKLLLGTAKEIDRCLRASAAAILENGTGPDGHYPAEWHKNPRDTKTNFNTQVSVLTALVAVLKPAQ